MYLYSDRKYNTQCVWWIVLNIVRVKVKLIMVCVYVRTSVNVYVCFTLSLCCIFERQLTALPCNLLPVFEQNDRCNKIPFDKFYFRIIFTSGFSAWGRGRAKRKLFVLLFFLFQLMHLTNELRQKMDDTKKRTVATIHTVKWQCDGNGANKPTLAVRIKP